MDKWQLEGIVYIARKLHWTLADIGKLSPGQFDMLLAELIFQESQEEYQKSHRVASLMATIINCTPRKDNRAYHATDFIGQAPQREGNVISSIDSAKKRGLKVPKEKE